MHIVNFRNTIFVHHTGDGFRTLALPSMLNSGILIVSSKMMIECHYKNFNAVTIHRLENHLKNKKIKVILLDCKIPREKSKAFQTLKKLCKGKQIAMINPPHDLNALANTMELMSVTKNPIVKTVVYDHFAFVRGYQ